MKTLRALVAFLALLLLAQPSIAQQSGGGGGGGSTGAHLPATGNGLTITSDAPLVDGTSTWNSAGTTFHALRVNITSTASAAASSLLQLRVGSANIFNIDKAGVLELGGRSLLSSDVNGDLLFTKNDGSNPIQIRFGTAVNLRVEGTGLAVYNPSLASYYDLTAKVITSTGGTDVTGTAINRSQTQNRNGLGMGNSASNTIGSTVPTISSGFGSSPTLETSVSAGTHAFRVNVGTGGVATSGVVALNSTAATHWNCFVSDFTGGIVTRVTADTTNTVTVTGASAWAASSILQFVCGAY